MSENEKALTDAYYWLSMYKSGTTTEDVAMEKVKEVIFEHPQLNDNQQVVLNQLCQIFMKQSYKSKMQAVYIFINKGMSDEFLRLDRNESNQVLAAFAEWGMEQEEE